jgi:SAM-dependent methyltransferase
MVFHLLPARTANRLGDRMRNAVAQWAERVALRWMRDADLILAGNEAVRDAFVARGFPPDRVRLHYPAVEVEEIRSAPPGPACDVIFVGRLVKQKGIHDFLRLVERLDLHFTVCGDGPEREAAMAWVKERGLAERVEWVRGLSRAELLGRIKASRCFVAPSYEEGFGLAVAEAIVAGTPVVAYDLPAFREVFGRVPRYVPVGETGALCDAMAEVLAAEQVKVEPDLSTTRIRGACEAAQEIHDALSTVPGQPSKPLGMVRFLWREHGLAFPVVVLGRLASFLWIQRPTRPNSFVLDGNSYRYVLRLHNGVYRTERAVELALATSMFPLEGRVLEIGNVLNQYNPFIHDIVDKYEIGEGVVNQDVLDFMPDDLYDLVVSISTLEHVGWDESPRDPAKAARAIAHLKTMVRPGGRMLVTFPLGYHQGLDAGAAEGTLGFTKMLFMKRVSRDNRWIETDRNDALGRPYGSIFPCANAIAVGLYAPPAEEQTHTV